MTASDIVVLGKVADPYGIRGWVRLHAFGDDPLAWAEMPVWWLAREGGAWREVKLNGLRPQGNGLVALLEGVTDRSGAEALKGMLIGAPRDALPVNDENEYYWADLLGLEVVNAVGESLGKVDNLIETGANAVLDVLAEDGTKRLLPFVAAVVLAVEKDAGRIRVEWGSDW